VIQQLPGDQGEVDGPAHAAALPDVLVLAVARVSATASSTNRR